nr:uncharacterized protein LOC123763746 [Procambarus clarkii]
MGLDSKVLWVGVVALWASGWVESHGRLMEPVSRSSAWRKGFDTPINYDDNALFCGGVGVQYVENDGQCGVCGDNWADPQPRDNEAGGTYGTGLIVANYTMGQYFVFKCEAGFTFDTVALNARPDTAAPNNEETMEVGPDTDPEWHYNTVRLPEDVLCTQCVLQWHYHTGNSWGDCGNGTEALGCGNQEIFRGCADIGIY